jgi:hypothetical protein
MKLCREQENELNERMALRKQEKKKRWWSNEKNLRQKKKTN